MSTLSVKVSSGNLESYEALFLQFGDPSATKPVDHLELVFGDVTQVFPSAFALIAAYMAQTSDPNKRLLVSRKFGSNPNSAKLERAMDAMGFLTAIVERKGQEPRAGSGVIPLIPILRDTAPEQVANRVLEVIVSTAQPTRDAKENLFVVLSELVENVVRHSNSECPGFICGQLAAQKRKLELCIVDVGIGVRESLESGKDADAQRRIRAGESALEIALEGGRTSKGGGNTGFGLFVARTATEMNRGVFRLTSGLESVIVSREGEKRRSHANWPGTVVNVQFNLDKLGSLAEVYRCLPIEAQESEWVAQVATDSLPKDRLVSIKADGPYAGSRAQAARVRSELHEAVGKGLRAVADFEGVLALTPGYADDCFGELLETLGRDQFQGNVVLRNASDFARLVIEAVLERRLGLRGTGKRAPVKPRRAPEKAAKPVARPEPRDDRYDIDSEDSVDASEEE